MSTPASPAGAGAGDGGVHDQAPPFPAATLVLTRRAHRGREVLLLRRPPSSTFAPDAWVFAGGRVDDEDRSFDHARLAAGPPPPHWAGLMGSVDPREAAAYPVAAIREAWEETGILLADPTTAMSGIEEARWRLLQGRWTLADFLRETRVRLATGLLRYFAHWVTPDWLPRRFDTRFFHAEVDPRTRCVLVGHELSDSRWVAPHDALGAEERGEIHLLPPTIDTLRRLARGEI